MDELSLGALLESATSPEPPLGHIVDNSLRDGRRLRRRRRATGAAALAAAAVVAVSAVPVLTSGAGHKFSKPEPAVVSVPPADVRTAYVTTGTGTVVPINLATNTAGRPIQVPAPVWGAFAATAAPNGRTLYELGDSAVTPINTATNTTEPAITLPNAGDTGFVVAPNGKAAYLSTELGVYPIDTATSTLGKRMNVGGTLALTPDGKTLYVLSSSHSPYTTGTVTPIRTDTNTALAPIKLPPPDYPPSRFIPSAAYIIAITPNGKTAYVVYGVPEGKPYANSVIPINLASNRALAPIPIEASGLAQGLVIAPGDRTAYVLSSRAVTPIDTATNQAEPAINLPATAGYAYDIALTPSGKTIYVLTPRGVIPITTASRRVLPMISVPKLCNPTSLAITPDGSTIYVGGCITQTRKWYGPGRRVHKIPAVVGGGVIPISTATNTAGQFINLGEQAVTITFAR